MSAKTPFRALPPRDAGMLKRPGGVKLAWSEHGVADGAPVLLLHGGPGSGRSKTAPRFFDPVRWRILAFDQRGCGESWPNAADDPSVLDGLTLDALISDIEALRVARGVTCWSIFGASWGATLGLAYAQACPDRVGSLLFLGATTTSAAEIDWLYRGIAPLFPAEWAAFCAGAPEASPDALVEAYATRLLHPDPVICGQAAADWHDWEAASILVEPDAEYPARWRDARYRLARARIITHVFRHKAWLRPGQLLDGMGAIGDLYGVTVQGRCDLEAPLATAWALDQRWPAGRLVIVPSSGHRPDNDAMQTAIMEAAASLLERAIGT